jgi:hypothetical protein
MKKSFLILIISSFSLLISCSNDNDSQNENQLPLKEYKITINGVLDGDYSNYPNPTNNSFISTYIKDDTIEMITYTEPLTNELNLEKVKIVSARNQVGVKLNINQLQTTFYYIQIKIEDLETGTTIYNNQISKSLVSENPNSSNSLEIKVLYDVATNSTTLNQ